MTDAVKKIAELDATTVLATTDIFPVSQDLGTVPITRKITWENILNHSVSEGNLVNGYIDRTVASNNVTVAIKSIAGSDPSSSNPTIVRIRNVLRSITSSLSVTVNAGAASGSGTFNLGSAELKTIEQDVFVYLGWRAASSTVFILISRIPHAKTYADFSATAANEKYGAYSGSAPASTDEVVNIGRFNITNSGTASYNWSVPATSIILSRPIYETRWLSWTPTWSASGSLTYTSVSTAHAKYKILPQLAKVKVRASGTLGGSASNILFCTKPFEATLLADTPAVGAGFTAGVYGGMYVTAASSLLSFIKYDNSNYATSGSNVVNMVGEYEV